jgi:menaquinol-cytochrome c reductase cytochrome b/c subunit
MSDKPKSEAGFGSDAKKDPRRIVFITKKTSAKVKGDVGPSLMSYPHLLLRELIAFQALTIVLVVIALLWDAPLEQLANPLLTPNPAKAPWYFLGLQELLHYFPPVVGGVLIPTLVVVALIVIPYFNVNIQGEPLWNSPRRHLLPIVASVLAALLAVLGAYEAWSVLVPTAVMGGAVLGSRFLQPEQGRLARFLCSRPIPWWVMTWFIAVALTLTTVGTFFRGPSWSWVWPWR